MFVEQIPINKIKLPKFLLRPVLENSVRFEELKDSMRDIGLLQPITVRPIGEWFEVIVGNHRFHSAKALHWETIPCIIREATDEQVLVWQIQENAIGVETEPIQYAVQIERLMQNNPDLTISRLSVMLRKSPKWISNVLSLTKLKEPYRKMVQRSELKLQAAYELAHLPRVLQDQYIKPALTLPLKELVPLIRGAIKEYRQAIHDGVITSWVERLKPVPYLRLYREIVSEWEKPTEAVQIMKTEGCETLLDAWKSALAWCLHYTTDDLVEQERIISSRQRKQERAEESRKKAREKLRILRKKHEGLDF